MEPTGPAPVSPPPAAPPPGGTVTRGVVRLDRVSRWYGNVVAVNDVTMTLGPGVTGLLGPNGAGKSTLIHLMAGFLAPSAGTVTLDGVPVWHNHLAYRRIGLVPESDGTYDGLTGWQFVLANAKLHRLPDPEGAARKAIDTVDMAHAQHRRIGTYSKGMKQRIKMATALVHEPAVLLLDEPFNGMDPRQRLHLADLLRAMGAQGRTVVFSSHILEEVEQIATQIEVVVAGRHAASGDFRAIRRLMVDRPHRYVIRSSDDRKLAAWLITDGSSTGVEVDQQEGCLRVQAVDVPRFTWLLPQVARDAGVRLYDVTPADESLESVFSYLVARPGPAREVAT
jgi:ABC-2 type transport system ATP-binding protein